MARLTEAVDIRPNQMAQRNLLAASPIQVHYATVGGSDWRTLVALQSVIAVSWYGKRNEWQTIKTMPVEIPASLGVDRIRVTLQKYVWKRAEDTVAESGVVFDDIRVFATAP